MMLTTIVLQAPGGLIFPDKATMHIVGIEDADYKDEKVRGNTCRASAQCALAALTGASRCVLITILFIASLPLTHSCRSSGGGLCTVST